MKILHTIPTLDISYGGPATCTYHLVRGLNVLSETDLLTIGSKHILWNDSFLKVVPNDALPAVRYSKNIAKFLNEYTQEYDLVHANTLWFFTSHQAAQAARKFDKPFVLSPHGMLYPNTLLGRSSWKKKLSLATYQRKDLEEADMLHATCRQEMEHLRNFGLKRPIAVVPNCLEIDEDYKIKSGEPRPENSRRRFGFVGRIARIKNIDKILSAWKLLGPKTNDAELVIVGGGDEQYSKELKDFAAVNNMANVRFTGFLTGEGLKSMVHSFDIQMLVSDSENFGMVVPEALINRVPVIATKGTPWDELPEKGCGWWIDNDVTVIADTVEAALQIPESERLMMGERGRQLVLDKYSVESVAARMQAVYSYILGKNSKPDNVYTL